MHYPVVNTGKCTVPYVPERFEQLVKAGTANRTFPGADVDSKFTPSPLDPSRAFQGLTAKQEAYARARFAGANCTEAYDIAYPASGGLRRTRSHDAYELDQNPQVVARIQQLVQQRDAATSLGPTNLNKEFVISGVMNLANNASTDAVKLRAFELLGKTVGVDLFRDVVVTERRERTSDEVDKELRERLEQLRAAAIDGTARDVTPPTIEAPRVDRRRKPAS